MDASAGRQFDFGGSLEILPEILRAIAVAFTSISGFMRYFEGNPYAGALAVLIILLIGVLAPALILYLALRHVISYLILREKKRADDAWSFARRSSPPRPTNRLRGQGGGNRR